VSARTEAGFTLLEVLVALAILGLAVVTLIELSSQGLRLVKTSGDYQQAVRLADRIAGDTKVSEEGIDTGEEGSFQWERRISLVPLPEELEPKETVPGREPVKLFAVTIDVRWGRNQLVELATLRTPTSSPGSAERGQQPQVIPSTGQPSTGQPTTSGSAQPGRSGIPTGNSR
jgi:general secretion pathway protein I